MLKKTIALMALLICPLLLSAKDMTWRDYINEAYEDDYYRALAYQFRKTASYQEFKNAVNGERNYKKKEMMAHFEAGDPFAAFLMWGFFEKNGKTKKQLEALERLYAYGTPYAKFVLAQNMVAVFQHSEISVQEGGYQLFYQTIHAPDAAEERENPRLQEILDEFGYKKIDKQMAKITGRIDDYSVYSGDFEFRYSVPPVSIQVQEDHPIELTVIKEEQ